MRASAAECFRPRSDPESDSSCPRYARSQHGEKPIQKSRGQDGIVVEYGGPLLIDPIGDDQGRATFIAMAENLKQALGPELVNGQVTQFINAQHSTCGLM